MREKQRGRERERDREDEGGREGGAQAVGTLSSFQVKRRRVSWRLCSRGASSWRPSSSVSFSCVKVTLTSLGSSFSVQKGAGSRGL